MSLLPMKKIFGIFAVNQLKKTDFKTIYYKKPEIATLQGKFFLLLFFTSPCFFFRKEKE